MQNTLSRFRIFANAYKLMGLLALLAVLGVLLFGALISRQPGHAQATVGPEPLWALPFPTGKPVSWGISGLHAGNFPQIPLQNPVYFLGNKTQPDASLDLGVVDRSHWVSDGAGYFKSTIPTTPLASGRVLYWWAQCNALLIDHYNGWWAIYLHLTDIQVSPGDQVYVNEPLGYATTHINPACETTSYPHVHFALLKATDAHHAQYVSMAGRTLCGYKVLSNQEAFNTPRQHDIVKTPEHPEGQESPLNLAGMTQRNVLVPNCPAAPPTSTQLQPPVAGHVLIEQEAQSPIYDARLARVSKRCNGQSDDGTHAVLVKDQQVMALSDTGIVDSYGNLYYKVAYPDGCTPNSRDFSSLPHILDGSGAVGYVKAMLLAGANQAPSLLGANAATATIPTARMCTWPPKPQPPNTHCPEQSYNTLTPSWTTPLLSADGSILYAYWDGKEWDPHFFHVILPGPGRQEYGVESQDWHATILPICLSSESSYRSACGTPQPSPSPTQTPQPVPTNTPQPGSTPPTPTNTPTATPTNTPTPPPGSPNLVVSAGVYTYSPAVWNQHFDANYTVQNIGNGPFDLRSLVIGMRGPHNENIDLGGDNDSTPIQPGQSRNIFLSTANLAGNCSTCGVGTYTIFASVWMTDGSYWQCPPTINGAQCQVTFNVGDPGGLQQQAPGCNNPSGVNWSPNPTSTSTSCTGNGLLMQQTSSTKYGELDLTQVNGGAYSQTNSREQVQAVFQNTGDCSTWAAIIFQTPAGSPGGYIFGVNPCGQWRLQQVITGTNIQRVAYGSVGFNASQPVTITVIVQNGGFTGYVNGQQVGTYNVGIPSGTNEAGLMVERDNASPSSWVLYSNFELDD